MQPTVIALEMKDDYMKTPKSLTALLGMIIGLCSSVNAQNQSTPPTITSVTWTISRYAGSFGLIDFYDPATAFDPSTMLAYERDLVTITIQIFDPDFSGEDGDAVFYIVQSAWLPVPGYRSPEPPPIAEDFRSFFPDEDGLFPGSGQILTVRHTFQIPEFIGQNQAKLRGLINYDVSWFIVIGVSNDQDPGCTGSRFGAIFAPCDQPVDWAGDIIYAAKNPLVTVPNPPPFADAGTDRTVNPGTVVLDGSRSIDLYNLGFNTDSSNVFEKDVLTYTWEWLSGPARVDPQQDAPTNPRASVILTVEGVYVYRLTVDDNVNALPSTDIVTITVSQLRENYPPIARIDSEPAGKRTWTVGEIVTLASTSIDPDGDDLSYRWQQTDELGGQLPVDLLAKVFQPMSGVTGNKASWQALLPGTYYFRLLVSDGEYTATTRLSINIIESTAAGASIDNSNVGESGGEFNPLGAAGACGFGMLPWAIAPLAYCILRRRE